MSARVLILGGGFAGIGAARALKKADAEVVVGDEHDLGIGLLQRTGSADSRETTSENQDSC